MSVTVQEQSWEVYRGEDLAITLTNPSGDADGYALLVTWSLYDGQSPVTGATGVTSGAAVSADGDEITFTMTRAATSLLTRCKYRLDWFRTDSGSNLRLAGGTLYVLTPVRLPA